MALKPGPKPIAKSTGKPDQRRRDNKTTPGNTPELKPSKSSKPPKRNERGDTLIWAYTLKDDHCYVG
jgi:hypothetical protein